MVGILRVAPNVAKQGSGFYIFVEKEEVEPSDHNFPPSGWEGWGENNLQGQGRRRRRRRG